MSLQTTAEARNNTEQELVTFIVLLEATPGGFIDAGNTTLGGITNIRKLVFSTQSNTEALEEGIREENEIQGTFLTKTFNTTSGEPGDLHDNLVWNLIENGEMDLGLLAASLGILLVVIVMLSLYFMMRSKRFYSRIPGTCEGQDYEYIYKPLAGGAIDEEYENTFVGVSIPLIQDVSKV